MRVLQVTNIVSHHQLPLARQLAARLGPGCFRLAATQAPFPERVRLGWDTGRDEEWVLRPGERRSDQAEYMDWWERSDVVLCGDRLLDLFQSRLERGRLVCYMSERWWKPPIGMARLCFPGSLRMALRFRAMARSPMFQYLAAGKYAASDMGRLVPLGGRSWRWGYFPPEPEDGAVREPGGDTFRVLWAGRMLGWKRVDTLLRGFGVLSKDRGNTRLTLIGRGPRETDLRRLVARLGLCGNVSFQPACQANEVREWMRRADVYVLPSNGYEGWGAVLNEAMGEGCAAVACEEVGAARELIRDGENGRLFRVGDWRGLGAILRSLRDSPLDCKRISEAGVRTVCDEWSPGVAAARLLAVCEAVLGKKAAPEFPSGPMSRVGE